MIVGRFIFQHFGPVSLLVFRPFILINLHEEMECYDADFTKISNVLQVRNVENQDERK